MRAQIADAPVDDPDDDLLGTAPYARTLAEFVYTLEPPFTVGIYGEWGSGKTSFVNFVRSYLKSETPQGLPPVRFVAFSAWPYKTSDELWRALIVEIAGALLLKPSADASDGRRSPPQEPAAAPPARRSGLREFLARDALLLRPPPPETGPQADYDRLLSRLDAMHGGVGKGPQGQVDPEQLGLTLANAAVAALATMSPLAAAARKVFGMPSGVDTAKLIPRERNEATRDRIQSMEQFRSEFKELFEGALKPGERVVVFIDDLDRCMPDAALDLLEAVKIFLGEVRCVFIVAADEQLIGQGLRLRYRDLVVMDGGDAGAEVFARKGQEYFEKIIQLAIRVPQRTAEQTHNFISAQFPEWLPATDIIQAAIGGNPRRLKQYCSWLQYRWMVSRTLEEERQEEAQAQGRARARERAAVLEKTIALARWSREALATVVRLASEPGTFAAAMETLESALERTPGNHPDPEIAGTIAEGPVRALYQVAAESAPLSRLFPARRRFSRLPPVEVAAAACLADARPHPTELFTSRDAPFVRVFSQVTSGAEVSAEKLVQEAFAWLLELAERAPKAVRLAARAARSAGPGAAWTEQMLEVERQLASGGSGPPLPAGFSPSAQALLEWARTPSAEEPLEGRAQLLLAGSLRLSMLLREEVLAFEAAVPGPRQGGDASGPMGARARAKAAHASAPLATGTDDPRPGLEFRVWAARHFIQLRKFAKLDAFFRRWPELARRLATDRTSITTLEAQLISPQTLPEPLQVLWEQHRGDRALLELLSLRPLFLHIEDAELDRYMLVSRALAAGDRGPPPTPVVAAAMAQAAAAEEPAMLNVLLEVSQPAEHGGRVQMRLSVEGRPGTQGDVLVSRDEVEQRLRELPLMMRDLPVIQEASHEAASPLTYQVSDGGTSMQIEAIGRFVFERVLPESVRMELMRLLQGQPGLRVLWKVEEGTGLTDLPLEAMWVVPARMCLALSPKHSVVRLLSAGLATGVRPIARPLRILAVFANPIASARLDVRAEAEVMRRVLRPAMADGRVLMETLVEEEATLPRLQEMLRTFKPHVLHFVGHGTYQHERQEGALVLHEPGGGGPRMVTDADVRILVQDKGLQLVVLNGCETGRASPQDAVSGIAGLLVHGGVPAVVATLRAVLDDPAILFTREFYRTFADGHPVEEAVVEARKALSVERWDWTPYALFTSTSDLRSIRLPAATARGTQAPV